MNSDFHSVNPARKSLTQYFVLTVFCLLVAGPIATYGCRGEHAKWMAASAMNLYLSNDKETALKKLHEAVVKSNYDPILSSGLANLLAENGKAEQGLEISNKVLEIHGDSGDALNAVMSKSNCLQHLDRPKQALAALKSMHSELTPTARKSDARLNNLAYYRALADVELPQARKEIRAVIRNQTQKATWPEGYYHLTLSPRTYISIGLLSRHLENHKNALYLLDREIEELTDMEFREDRLLSETVYEAIQNSFPLSLSEEKDLTDTQRLWINRRRDSLAFLLLTRALIHQDLGNEKECDRDRIKIHQIGYDADVLLDRLPSNQQCLEILNQASTFLDTYGYVLFRQEEFGAAKERFDLAIEASELNLLALDSPLHNSSEELMFDAEQLRPAYKKETAVLHYHRYELYRRMQEIVGKESGLEAADARRIRELGFDPDSRLF